MSFARYYPLDATCRKLCAGERLASEFLDAEAALGRTVFDTLYASHDEADAASRTHPAFLAYIQEIEALQTRHGDTGAIPYRSAYGSPAFGFDASQNGISLYVKHWIPAPVYPCGHDLVDIMRLDLSCPSRDAIPLLYGPAGPLRTLALKRDFKGVERVIERFHDTGALLLTETAIYLRYFPLKAASPVLSRTEGQLETVGYARNAAEARQITNTPAQLETIALSDRHESAETAIAEASKILNPRWFAVETDPDVGTHCVSDVWMVQDRTVSRRGSGMAGGGGAARPVQIITGLARSGSKGSDRCDIPPESGETASVTGELDLLTRGNGT